jgi:hypothetical protein
VKLHYLLLCLALSALPACSHSHPKTTGLQSRSYAKYIKASKGNGGYSKAYAKYVQKSVKEREKRRSALAKQRGKLPSPDTMTPSEPREETQISAPEGPQAVPRDSGNQ